MPNTSNTSPDPKRRSTAVDWAVRYFAALENGDGLYGSAAKAAGVAMSTVYRRRITDVAFADRERESRAILQDKLEDEVFRRAVIGVKIVRKTKYGKEVEIRYSDLLLLRLLERHDASWRPGKGAEPKSPHGMMQYNTLAERRAAVASYMKALADKAEAQKTSMDRG